MIDRQCYEKYWCTCLSSARGVTEMSMRVLRCNVIITGLPPRGRLRPGVVQTEV
jgi:hypothetical protein